MNEEQPNQYASAFGMFLFCQLIFRLILLTAFVFLAYWCWVWRIHNLSPIGIKEGLNVVLNNLMMGYLGWTFFYKLFKWSK